MVLPASNLQEHRLEHSAYYANLIVSVSHGFAEEQARPQLGAEDGWGLQPVMKPIQRAGLSSAL